MIDERKDRIYNIVFIGSIVVLLIVVLYLFTHSSGEYATKSELYVSIIGVITGFSGMLWAIWSKLTDLSMKIGEMYGWRNGFTKRKK